MNTELQATTEPGRRFVALAEEHAADFATRAAEHDRDGSFPSENIEKLRDSGFLAGPVPEEFGGMDVDSFLDLMIGMSRVARGCASTAIAANMHMSAATEMARLWRMRDREKPGGTAMAARMLLQGIGARQIIACAPNTENGTDLSAAMTEAVRDGDSYVINGRKAFGTLSPVATLFISSVRVADGNGGYLQQLAVIPATTPGIQVMDNWDAMGMRASGSHDVTYTDVRVPAGALLPGTPWDTFLPANAFWTAAINSSLIACFLGIAEAARDIAIEMAGKRKGAKGNRLADRTQIQHAVGEMEADLCTARAVTERLGRITDEFYGTHATWTTAGNGCYDLMKEQQLMKLTLQRSAISVVDKAMTISGGAGYMAKHPLSRMYRDVRAGPFMQPLGEYEIYDFAGRVALGIDPPLVR